MRTDAQDQDAVSGARCLRSYSCGAALFAVLLGGAVILGWVLGIDTLKRVRPGLIAMNPTTALAFVLGGFSLWARRLGPGRARLGHAAKAAAACVLIISFTKIAQYAVGGTLDLDRVLLRSALEAESGIRNVMAPNTAFALGLLGAALLLLDMPVKLCRRAPEVLALIAATVGLLACVGYLYGVEPLYGVAKLVPMALHTAAGVLVLATGVLAARPDHAIASRLLSGGSGGLVARRLFPGAIAIVIALGWLRLKGQQVGLFDSEFGVSLMSVATILLMAGLIWSITATLDRTDARRDAAETELRQAHATLRERSELLRAILDSVGDGIIVCDGSGSLLLHNSAATELLGEGGGGSPTAEWSGHPGLRLADGRTQFPREELALPRACRGEAVHDQEQFFRVDPAADGSWLSVSAVPLRGWRGDAAVAVVRDVTARKQIEQRLESQNDALEALVASRTAELQHSNEELRQFAYVASHDLQEPLRMVTSYLQLLERRYGATLDGDAHEFIGYAVDGANRMKQLITDLLQLSRVDRKGGSMVETDSGAAVDDALANLDAAISEAAGTVDYRELPAVHADPGQLRQLLQNLIGNAIKFRGSAPPKVSVTAERSEGMWLFSVSDNGIGIEPQYTSRIFEVFQRLHDRSNYPGTGIGLAICKKIVERHGGRIWVESRPGAGATFRFTIPVNGGHADANRLAA